MYNHLTIRYLFCHQTICIKAMMGIQSTTSQISRYSALRRKETALLHHWLLANSIPAPQSLLKMHRSGRWNATGTVVYDQNDNICAQ